MNVLSLFDGISCGQIALERAGIKVDTYCASEIDKYAIQVTQNNYPNTLQLGDINNINFTQFQNKTNLLIGGSPCQDLSIAKKDRKGLEGNKSGLFWKYVEALNIIKPKYYLLENVASMKQVDKDIITRELNVKPILIDSSLISGQLRKRLYWTNIPGVEQPENKNISLQSILENGYTDRKKSFCLDATYCKGGNLKQYFEKSRRQIIFNNIEDYIQCKTCYKDVNIKLGERWRHLSPLECERLQTVPENYTYGMSKTQRYKMLGNGWTVDVIVHILKHINKIKI